MSKVEVYSGQKRPRFNPEIAQHSKPYETIRHLFASVDIKSEGQRLPGYEASYGVTSTQ